MIEYKDMHWKDNKLFLGNKDTTISYVQDNIYTHMYWLEWNFNRPEKSVNCYNLTNAKDNARVLYLRHYNNTTEKRPREARGCV